ncbi:MAG: hypothetical protein ACOYXU_07260 [Nitrospirota bacterium]
MRTLIEFVVAAGLALIFHFALSLEHEAYILFGVGVLLTLAVHLILDRVAAVERRSLDAVARAHRIDSVLERVRDPEAMVKSRTVLDTTHHVLTLLSEGAIPLTEGEYYFEAGQCLSQCTREIRAVNSVDVTDWVGKVQKRKYYHDQVRTRQRGVAISRIFVLRRADLDDPAVLETIRHQQQDGISVRIALHEDLAFSGREGVEMPTNFVLFDDKVLIIRTPLLGLYYGKKTRAPEEIERSRRTYELLDQYARPLADLLPQAAGADASFAEAS